MRAGERYALDTGIDKTLVVRRPEIDDQCDVVACCAQRRREQSGDPFGSAADQRGNIDRDVSAAGHACLSGCSRDRLRTALSFGTNKHSH